MKSKTIYIFQDDLFESMYGAPCVVLKRKTGMSKQYIEIEFLFNKDTFLCHAKDLKKATPAMTSALGRAHDIYTKSKALGELINEID